MDKFNEILDSMCDIEYGYITKDGTKHTEFLDFNDYILESYEEVKENKIGVCWDQVEYERKVFEDLNYKVYSYFIIYYNEQCPTHTFLVIESDNKYYWFEHSYEKYRGVYEYNSLKELIEDATNKFVVDTLKNNYVKENLKVYEYTKPQNHLTVEEFIKYCENGKIIKFIEN